MSYSSLLTDRCDVYHLQTVEKPGTYGLPSTSEYGYAATPDVSDVPCFFSPVGYTAQVTAVSQGPSSTVHENLRMHFSIGTDVRQNDRVNLYGLTYKLQEPRKVRNHHIEVIAYREVSM